MTNIGYCSPPSFFLQRALNEWNYDLDPMDALRYEAPLKALRARLDAGEAVFEGVIAKYLVHNPHRLTVEMQPSATLQKTQDDAETARLAAHQAGLSPEDMERLVAETAALKKHQVGWDDGRSLY